MYKRADYYKWKFEPKEQSTTSNIAVLKQMSELKKAGVSLPKAFTYLNYKLTAAMPQDLMDRLLDIILEAGDEEFQSLPFCILVTCDDPRLLGRQYVLDYGTNYEKIYNLTESIVYVTITDTQECDKN